MAITQDIGGEMAPSTDVGNPLYMHTIESAGSMLLIQEEKQREFKPRASLSFDSSALSVNSRSNEAMKSFRTNYSTNSNHYQGNRTRSYCDYCKKLGHTKARCYKLIGYPTQGNTYRGRGKGLVAAVHGSLDDNASAKRKVVGHEGSEEQGVTLSKEQYNQLLGMMQQYQDHNANANADANARAISFAEKGRREADCFGSVRRWLWRSMVRGRG